MALAHVTSHCFVHLQIWSCVFIFLWVLEARTLPFTVRHYRWEFIRNSTGKLRTRTEKRILGSFRLNGSSSWGMCLAKVTWHWNVWHMEWTKWGYATWKTVWTNCDFYWSHLFNSLDFVILLVFLECILVLSHGKYLKICFCFVFFLSVPLESVNWLSNIFGVPSSLRDLFITYSACHAHVHIQWTHNLLACLNQYCVRRRFSLWVHIPRILSAISIRMCRSSGRISQKKQRK